MNHVMIDLETLGTRPTSVFLSIAAVQFDINSGEIGQKFYKTIDMDSAMKAGLTIDAATIEWWMNQKAKTRADMFSDAIELKDVMLQLICFFQDNDLLYPWGNSASFDLSILLNGLTAVGYKAPWKFWNERCYRTFARCFPHLGEHVIRGEQHNPTEDCLYQINKLCYIWSKIDTGLKLTELKPGNHSWEPKVEDTKTE